MLFNKYNVMCKEINLNVFNINYNNKFKETIRLEYILWL